MGLRASALLAKFLFTIFVARYLSLEALGIFGLVASIIFVYSAIIDFALFTRISRNAVTQTNDKLFKELTYYSKYAFFVIFLTMVLALIMAAVLGNYSIIMLSAVIIVLEYLNNNFYNLLLNLSRPFMANFLYTLRSGVWMIIYMVAALAFPECRSISYLLLFWLMGAAISLVILSFLMRKLKEKPPLNSIKPTQPPFFTWFRDNRFKARKLYHTNIILTISQYMSHFLISALLGLELLGVYVYYMQVFSALLNLLDTGVIQLYRPKLVKLFKSAPEDYKASYLKCVKHTLLLACLMGAASIPVIYYITAFLNRPMVLEYFSLYPMIFMLLMLTVFARVRMSVFYSQHRDELTFTIYFVNIVVGVGLTITFVLLFNLYGAVLAALILACVQLYVQKKLLVKHCLLDASLQNG